MSNGIFGSNYTTSASSYGLSGLVSGMETEKMVEKMLSGTQAKIDKQVAQKQQLAWKQDIYRDMISLISGFQSSFFNATSNTNLLSQSFFNTMSATTSSSAFSVTSTSNAISGDMRLKIDQLASNTSMTSAGGVSGKLSVDLTAADYQRLVDKHGGDRIVKFDVNGSEVTVDMSDAFVDGSGNLVEKTSAERTSIINQKLEDAFASFGDITAKIEGGALSITSTNAADSIKVKANGSTDNGLKTLGLAATAQAFEADNMKKMTGTADVSTNISFTITLDDLAKEVSLDASKITDSSGQVDAAKLKDELQSALNKAHGVDQIKVEADPGNADRVMFKVGQGRKVMINAEQDVLAAMDVKNGQSNRIGMGGSLKDNYFATPLSGSSFKFSINDVEFSFDQDARMSEVMNTINASNAGVRMVYRPVDDKFTLERTETGEGHEIRLEQTEGNLLDSLFGNSAATGTFADAVVKPGENAIVWINGSKTERSSNNFTVDGLNIQLKSKTDPAQLALHPDGEEITVTRGTDQIVDGIKAFINDYNSMIDKINGLLGEDQNYKSYAPLTAAQKAEMSEREIELWEQKAKEGLLRNDSTLSSFLQSMRSAMFEVSASAGISLFNLGIDTSDNWRDKGKLVLSPDGETKLRNMIESNPDAVNKLFTSTSDGLAVKLNSIIKSAANTSSGSPGSLVSLAGIKGKVSETNNTIYSRLREMDSKISQLQVKYEKEKARYWNQFNAMEQVIANMSAQSSWLASMFVQ